MVELNEKGHDPKLVSALRRLVERLEATPEPLRGPFLVEGLKPYLPIPALPAPDDGLEVVAWAGQGAIPISAFEMAALIDARDGDAYLYTDALVRLSEAMAALQSKDEQIEWLTRERNYWQAIHDERTKFLGNCAAEKEATDQQVQKLTAENERLREALEPFANTADHDIGTDEADTDTFQPMTSHNSALRITVGDMCRARSALETQEYRE